MPEVEDSAQVRGLRKAAIALIALGPKAAAAILKHIPEEEVERLTNAIAQTSSIDPNLAEAILKDGHAAVTGRKFYLSGGMEYAKKMLEEAFGREMASQQIGRLIKLAASEEAQFEQLGKVDPQQLAKLIQSEHPQAIAVILSRLYAPQAALVISHLPNELHADLLKRIAGLDHVSPEMMRLISQVVRQKLHAFGEFSRESCGGVKSVADICNRLEPSICNRVIETFEADDPELCAGIRRLMFVFEDLVKVDGPSLRELISQADRKLLIMALKGTSTELQTKVFQQLSARAAEMMREDMEALGPVKLRDVDAAQQEIISLARSLERDSRISLNSSGREEAYVV